MITILSHNEGGGLEALQASQQVHGRALVGVGQSSPLAFLHQEGK